MKEEKEWVFFKDIDFDCPNFNRFNIDTRDFRCGYQNVKEEHPDMSTLSKYPKFFYTKEEVLSELERLYNESGGENKWRFLELVSNDNRVLDWNLKYIRIIRTNLGFIFCNKDYQAIRKDILSAPVSQEHLNAH
jgi:hypothetical protein